MKTSHCDGLSGRAPSVVLEVVGLILSQVKPKTSILVVMSKQLIVECQDEVTRWVQSLGSEKVKLK